MASMWVKVEECICNCAKMLCGSLRNAALLLGVILGGVALVAGGVEVRYDFMPLVVTRASQLLFFGCLALVWGIYIARVELLLGYLSAASIVVPTSIVGVISYFCSYRYPDTALFTVSIISSVVLPLHMVIVHGLMQEMKGVKTASPPKDEWVRQNLTVVAKDELMEKKKPVELPAVFTPVHSAQIA